MKILFFIIVLIFVPFSVSTSTKHSSLNSPSLTNVNKAKLLSNLEGKSFKINSTKVNYINSKKSKDVNTLEHEFKIPVKNLIEVKPRIKRMKRNSREKYATLLNLLLNLNERYQPNSGIFGQMIPNDQLDHYDEEVPIHYNFEPNDDVHQANDIPRVLYRKRDHFYNTNDNENRLRAIYALASLLSRYDNTRFKSKK